jgi:hypothetical protein
MHPTVRAGLKIAASVVATMLLVAVGACAWLKWSPRTVPAGQPQMAALDAKSLPGFRAAFNGAEGNVRILAMLSPT